MNLDTRLEERPALRRPARADGQRRVAIAAALAALLAVAFGLGVKTAPSAQAATPTWILPDSAKPLQGPDPERQDVELGVRFVIGSAGGTVDAIRYYKLTETSPARTASLWSTSGTLLASGTFPVVSGTATGWQVATLSKPVLLNANTTYVASYRAPAGRYAADQQALGGSTQIVRSSVTALAGVFANGGGYPSRTWNNSNYFVDVRFTAGASTQPATPTASTTSRQTTTTTARPVTSSPPTTSTRTTTTTSRVTTPTSTTAGTTQAPSSTGFPSESNTGVPSGVALSAYTGPMKITASGTVIDAKRITGTLVIAAANVKISRSQVSGNIDSDSGGASVIIEDSEVIGGTSKTPAIGYNNITMRRVEVTGSRVSVLCGSSCDMQDSLLHKQYMATGSDWHVNGYVSNGGSNVLVKHNTIACDVRDNSNGGGCTGPAASFGDFAPLSNIKYDNNLLVASPGGYCLAAGYNPTKPYGSNPTGIVVINNVFQRGSNGKCGAFGPVTSFRSSGVGNVWSNNVWDNGGSVLAAQ